MGVELRKFLARRAVLGKSRGRSGAVGQMGLFIGMRPAPGFAVDKGDSVELHLYPTDAVDGYDVNAKVGDYPTDMSEQQLRHAFEATTGRPAKSKIESGTTDQFEGGFIVTWDETSPQLWKVVPKGDPNLKDQQGDYNYWHDGVYQELVDAGYEGQAMISTAQ
jgi:hypothetical protein